MTATTKTYRITNLSINAEFVAEALRLTRDEGLPLTKAAKALETSPGRVAMALLITDTPQVKYADKDDLAQQVTRARQQGDSWGLLAARYRVTEGTCRAAFTYGAKTPFFAVDYRGWKSLPETPVAEAKAHGAKARSEVKLTKEGRESLGQAVERKAREARQRRAKAAGAKAGPAKATQRAKAGSEA